MEVHTLTATEQWNKISCFGIIIDGQATYQTKGPHLRSQIMIIDESSLENPAEKKIVICYGWILDRAHQFPFGIVGDIIRIDRAVLDIYENGPPSVSSRQLKIVNYSVCLIWLGTESGYRPKYVHFFLSVSIMVLCQLRSLKWIEYTCSEHISVN